MHPGYQVGMNTTAQLSQIIALKGDDKWAEQFMKAIKDWHDFVENRVEPSWMVEMRKQLH